MNENEKIPLKKRLAELNTGKPTYLPVFDLYTCEYFEALAEMSGNSYFRELYLEHICTYSDEADIYSMARMAHAAYELQNQDAAQLLYILLLEPFLEGKIWR